MILSTFLVGLPVMFLSLTVQVAAALWAVRYAVQRLRAAPPRFEFLFGMYALLMAMLILLLGTLVQIIAWGGLFVLLGEFNEMYEAVHHSAVNYTSLGYGDFVMSKRWKLLGPLEAVNGVLMLGMTGGVLMTIAQQLIKNIRDE